MRCLRLSILLVGLLPAWSLAGETLPLDNGMPLPSVHFNDQHDQATKLDATVSMIVFAPDREAGELAQPVMNALKSEGMRSRGIKYIADISAMPSLVTRMFALPKMRDYPYPVLLGREAGDTAFLPRQAGRVTLLRLGDGVVEAVEYFGDSNTLAQSLDIAVE